MVFKYLMVIGFMGTVSMAVASTPTVPMPAPTPEPTKVEAPTAVPAKIETPLPAPVTAPAAPVIAPTSPVPAPVKEVAPDPNPVQHAILNALEKHKNSAQVDELITITLQDGKYEVSIKLSPNGKNTGFLTLGEFLTTVSEDHLRNAKEKGEYASFAYKKGNRIGLTDLTAGSTGNNYKVSRLSLKFKKIP